MVRFADQAVSSQLRRDPHNLIGQPLGIPLFAGDVIEIEIIRKNEELGMAEMRMDETQWEGKTAYFLSLGDNTDRKQVEESLRELDRKKSSCPTSSFWMWPWPVWTGLRYFAGQTLTPTWKKYRR